MTEQAPDRQYDVEAQRVRRELEAEGRSENLQRLFDYLLAHSHDIRAPKEIEIAFEVFGKDVRYDTSQDAMVRVYVHRLRGRLDEIYQGTHGSRLTIPKGEYRVILVENSLPPTPDEDVTPSGTMPQVEERGPFSAILAGRSLKRFAIFAFVMTALGWGMLFYVRGRSDAQIGLATSAYQSAEERCGIPLLVTGDSYLYFQSGPGDHSHRLIMRPTIGSAAQLDALQSGAIAKGEQIRDRDDYYMSASAADGLWSLLGTLSARQGDDLIVPVVLPNSKLTPEVLNGRNIIYFGRLDQLAMLHDIVFQASRFTFDPISDTLGDPGSRREFKARLTDAINDKGRNPLKRPAFAYDYGYFARIAKPNGCAVWIVAGLEDSALPQMVRIVGDPARLEALFSQSRGKPSFEALYEIRSVGVLRYKDQLILVRPLGTAH